jgi:hypothetical protein
MVVYVLICKLTSYPLGVFSSEKHAWKVAIERLANHPAYSTWGIADLDVIPFEVQE